MNRIHDNELPSVTFEVPLNISISIGKAELLAIPTTQASPSPTKIDDQLATEKVPVIFPKLEDREGYQDSFLGFGTVPLPELTEAGRDIAARLDDGSNVLHYHKFSVVMHKKRRLALFTASNVDWRDSRRKINGRKPSRKELNGFLGNEKEDWVTDSRIPGNHQLPDYFYVKDKGAFDRGHLVRRDDVAWGDSFDDMQMGNGDTFHTTNCSPQVAGFNQASLGNFNWGELENMIQKETKSEKVCVFSGPVLAEDDPFFHGLVKSRVEVSIQIPRQFWKIIVAEAAGAPAAFGFVLDQDLSTVDLHTELVVPNAWKRFMRPLSEIDSLLNGLATLGPMIDWDQFDTNNQ